MRPRHQAFSFAITACLLAGAAMAADDLREDGPFVVDRAVLAGLAGTLEVRVVTGDAARLTLSGPADAVAAMTVDAGSGRLLVEAPAAGHSVTVVDRLTVVTGPGATSDVVIGSSSTARASSRGAARTPVDVVLELPAGSRLELLGFTGAAEIGDLAGPVVLEAVGGVVRTGAVTAADLAAVGDGRVEAASVTGDLAARVTGAGRIAVRGGEVDALTVEVIGAGKVEIDAPAASAVVDMVGDGAVQLAVVASEPVVNRVGSGRFSAGPR